MGKGTTRFSKGVGLDGAMSRLSSLGRGLSVFAVLGLLPPCAVPLWGLGF